MSRCSISFWCVRGVQAGTEYYVCMVPYTMLSNFFVFKDDEMPPTIRAQRIINKSRIPEMKNYILQNPSSYVFSALTASVDGEVTFTSIDHDRKHQSVGRIEISSDSRILINDGQHRKAAIESALVEKPSLKYEDIAIVIYADSGLRRSQQMFSDLNRYAIRPTKSLNILYDQRDPFASIVCRMIDELPMFGEWVDKERANISNRSKALFTLSGIYASSMILLKGVPDIDLKTQEKLMRDFWIVLLQAMPRWQQVIQHKMRASQLRQQEVSAHAIAHKAMAIAGNELLMQVRSFSHLSKCIEIDWSKNNPIWNGHVIVNGNISASNSSVQYIADVIRKTIAEVDV